MVYLFNNKCSYIILATSNNPYKNYIHKVFCIITNNNFLTTCPVNNVIYVNLTKSNLGRLSNLTVLWTHFHRSQRLLKFAQSKIFHSWILLWMETLLSVCTDNMKSFSPTIVCYCYRNSLVHFRFTNL